MKPRTVVLAGTVGGAATGLAFLVGGTLVVIPGAVFLVLAAVEPPRLLGAGGFLAGFGAAWIVTVGQATWRCASDASCSQPDMASWLGVGAAILLAGVALSLLAWRGSRPRA